jgi:hypothetical protein
VRVGGRIDGEGSPRRRMHPPARSHGNAPELGRCAHRGTAGFGQEAWKTREIR